MKQAIIASDGLTVANVDVVADDFVGPLVLPDDAYVGPGMLWDQSLDAPLFTFPADLADQTSGLWNTVKAWIGLSPS